MYSPVESRMKSYLVEKPISALADGRSFAVRPSGTEPKIKYYLFGHGKPGAPVKEALPAVQASLDSLWAAVEKDALARSNG